MTRARPIRKGAQADDLPLWRVPTNDPDVLDSEGQQVSLLLNGVPAGFAAIVVEVAHGVDPRSLIRPTFAAWAEASRKWCVRDELRGLALDRLREEMQLLKRERDLIEQRQALSEVKRPDEAGREWSLAQALGIAAIREGKAPPVDPGELGTSWGETDDRRIEHIDGRIAYLVAQTKTLDGRGDSGSRLRDFATALIEPFRTATGKGPDARKDFVRFVIACVDLVGGDIQSSQVEAVCASVAKSNK